jgi:hypothetical protein
MHSGRNVKLVYFAAFGAYGINLWNIWCGAGWRIFISLSVCYRRQQKIERDFVFTYWPVMSEELIFDELRTAIGASCSTICRPLCTVKHKGVTLAFHLTCGKDSIFFCFVLVRKGDQLPICRKPLMYYTVVKSSRVSYLVETKGKGKGRFIGVHSALRPYRPIVLSPLKWVPSFTTRGDVYHTGPQRSLLAKEGTLWNFARNFRKS